MTSQHCNPQSHKRSINFCGLMWEMLRHAGHEVHWQDPDISMTTTELKKFDHVIVGLAPLSALGANRAYGALSIIERLWSGKRLTLLVDAPDPSKIQTSVQAVLDHPETLVKDFFSYRKAFRQAKDPEVLTRLLRAVELLNSEKTYWPNVIVPGLPWQNLEQIEAQLPVGASGHIHMINLDYLIFDRYLDPTSRARRPFWSYEKNSLPGWLERQRVVLEVNELPSTFRVETNVASMQQLAVSLGTLISPSKAGTWWSPRYAMSISQVTPVFTDWRASSALGNAWAVLPASFELATDEEKEEIGIEQHTSYLYGIPEGDEALNQVYHILGSSRLYNRKASDTWWMTG
jgi:hypothetical protein